MGHAKASCGDLAGILTTITRVSTVIFGPRWQSWTLHCPNDVRCPYGDRTMSLRRVYGLRVYDFFEIVRHCAELNKNVEATMPVNPYDDRKVSLRRPHGNGDLDIVLASYTRRKANVTEAYHCSLWLCHAIGNLIHGLTDISDTIVEPWQWQMLFLLWQPNLREFCVSKHSCSYVIIVPWNNIQKRLILSIFSMQRRLWQVILNGCQLLRNA